MIALDTSALISMALREPGWEELFVAIREEPDLLISAVTVAETLIVAAGRNVAETMPAFIAELGATVVPVAADTAARVSAIYSRWGKGNHPARLNFCDCFAYDVAKENDCALLFIGNDFSQTDIKRAIDS